MRLGIDFGTTHTVVAAVDRGNVPVVAFDGEEVVPSLVAGNAKGELLYGRRAAAVRRDPEWALLRSFKRLLAEAGPQTEVLLAGREYLLQDLLAGFLAHLRADLLKRSNAGAARGERLEVAVSVPANAGSAQRFLTMEGFRRAGFEVVALLNEPSAAGFEYAHRYRSTITSRREYVAVYDLGGGTFDASLLKMTGRSSEVVTSSGVSRLGGDDFDEAILELVLDRRPGLTLDPARKSLLLEECVRLKESIHPSTRRLLVDLSPVDDEPLALPVEEVFAACGALVEQTLSVLDTVLVDPGRDEETVSWDEVAGIYVVGGGGSFPPIARRLREKYGERRVKRSPHPFAATAMGLAVFLDREAGYSLADRLSRVFGVFREAASGEGVSFDPVFGADTPLPGPGEPPRTTARRYRAAHNLGHYRFVECRRVADGHPEGDVVPWGEFRFPFDPALRKEKSLARIPVTRCGEAGPEIEEVYSCTESGEVEVTLRVLADGFSRNYRLGR